MITLKLTLLVVLCIPLIAKLDKVSNDTITKEETNKLLYNIIFLEIYLCILIMTK